MLSLCQIVMCQGHTIDVFPLYVPMWGLGSSAMVTHKVFDIHYVFHSPIFINVYIPSLIALNVGRNSCVLSCLCLIMRWPLVLLPSPNMLWFRTNWVSVIGGLSFVLLRTLGRLFSIGHYVHLFYDYLEKCIKASMYKITT